MTAHRERRRREVAEARGHPAARVMRTEAHEHTYRLAVHHRIEA